MSIQLEILTPSKSLLKETVDEVVAPSVSGEVDVLPAHTDYMTILGPGTISAKKGSSSQDFNISGGLLTISHDGMTILADEVEDQSS